MPEARYPPVAEHGLQASTHLALISAAVNLDRQLG
jgi:hypothetical protein